MVQAAMGIFDVLWEAHWDELAAFFSKGNPPLIVQLLFLNTIIFVWLIVRRMRGASSLRPETASTIQSILLAANMFAIFQEDIRRSLHQLTH
jgi:hypothetical protein